MINPKYLKMNSRFSLLMIMLLSGLLESHCQVNLTLNVDPNPSPKVIEWALNAQTVTLTVVNLNNTPVKYRIKAELYKEGELIGETKPELMNFISVEATSTEIHFAEDIVPESAVKLYGDISKTLLKTNKIPAGNYRLCVKLIDENGQKLTNETCQPFIITDYQQPRLILPQDGSILPYTGVVPNLSFQWSAVVPQPKFPVTYTVRLVPMNKNQTKLNAFRYNTPIFEEDVINNINLQWPTNALEVEVDQNYVWAVISKDHDGEPIGENLGVSEIWEMKFDENNQVVSKVTSGSSQTSEPCPLTLDFSISNSGVIKFPSGSSQPNYVEYKYNFNDNSNELNAKAKLIDLGGGKKGYDKYTVGQRDVTHKVISGNCPEAIFQQIGDISNNNYPMKLDVSNCVVAETIQEYGKKGVKYLDIDFVFEATASTDLFKNGVKICQATTVKKFRYKNGAISKPSDNPFDTNPINDCSLNGIELPALSIKAQKSTGNGFSYTFSNEDESIFNGGNNVDWTVFWDFGDAKTSIANKPIHTYANGGSYVVTMRLERYDKINKKLCSVTKKKTIILSHDCNEAACNFDNTNLFQGIPAPDDSIYLCGNLKMYFNGMSVTKTGNKLKGTGIVYIPWLLTAVNVEFDDLVINFSKEIVDGEINAVKSPNCPSFPTQWAINAGYQLTQNQIKEINAYVNQNIIDKQDVLSQLNIPSPQQDILINTIKDKVQPVNVPLGFKLTEDGRAKSSATTLAISSIRFTPTQNYIKACLEVTPRADQDSMKLYFESKNFFFNSKGPINNSGQGDFSMDLLSRRTLVYTGLSGDLFKINFNPKDPTHLGTAMYFKSECNKSLDWCFSLDVDIEIPRKWLIPSPDDGVSSVFLHAEQELCNWDDYFVELNLPKCEIAGSNGFLLETNTLVWDASDIRNPDNIVFPNHFKGKKDELFQGFWMKQTRITLPDGLRTYDDPNKLIQVDLNNWIIEKQHGISGELVANNIVNFPSMNVTDLGASLDTFKMVIDRSTMTHAYLKGYITLPICDYDQNDPKKQVNKLEYKALFANQVGFSNDKKITFTVNPTNNYNCEFLANGSLEMYKTSKIEVVLKENGEKSFELALNGKLDFPDKKIVINENLKHNIEFEAKFSEMFFKYKVKSHNQSETEFDHGKWSFASPQKKFHRFPITVENFKGVVKNTNLGSNKLIKGGVSFDMIANLDDIIGGQANIALIGTLRKNQGERIKASFDTIELSDINVYANLAAVQLDGGVQFRNDDPIYGNGIGGYLSANFKSLSIKIDANAQFGNTNYQNGNQLYRYWQVSALVIAPKPGLPLVPGLAIRGAGLGAYKNMQANMAAKTIDLASSSSKDVGVNFTPKKSTWGFDVKAILASSPNEEAANGDVEIAAEFSGSGGISNLKFGGNLYIGCELHKRIDAIMNGNLLVTYDFTKKIFGCNITTYLNKDPISTPSGLSLNINSDGKKDLWSVKFGTPYNPNSVKVVGINLYSYLMFGNDIPAPVDFTSSFKTSYYNATGINPVTSSSLFSNVNNETQLGKGFAFGVGVKYNQSKDEYNLNGDTEDSGFRPKIFYDITAGAEMNLSMFKYNGSCGSHNPIGINSYYCKGSVGFYTKFDIGMEFVKKGKSCTDKACLIYCCKNIFGEDTYPNGFRTHLFSLELGASIVAGFPNPTHLKGSAVASTSFAGFSKTFLVNFEIGNSCTNNQESNSVSNIQENALDKIDKQFIKEVSVSSSELFDYRKPINVEYTQPISGYLFNDPNSQYMVSAPMDVSERQADGSVKSRTFFVAYTYEFSRQIPNGTYKTFPLKRVVNPIGSHDYYENTVNTTTQTNFDENGWPLPADPVRNKLVANNKYKLILAAALYEVNENGTSFLAKDKNNQEIKEYREIPFTTIPIVQESNSGSNSGPIIINNNSTGNSNGTNSTSNQIGNGN